ncbi:IS110 family transposase [Georgenia deserti]|uniref:IS110 family transposase n=1 Tax=Georgenia deserti TaxID=2093781 RepID=A0ABW4L8P2_9MICO
MTAYCGIDWAEAHHDLALVDEGGTMLAKRRISDDLAGFEELLQVLAEHGDCAEDQIPVAIETGRGLFVACMLATGRDVVVINPMAAARYRERTAVTRTKSDAADALMLANVLRTDRHAHRPLPKDSELVRSVAVLARAGQDAVWQRQQATNQLRSLLREYFPAALTAFQVKHIGLASAEARTVLAAAPTPAAAATLTKARLRSLLIKAGRRRNLETWVERVHEIFRTKALRHPAQVEDAYGVAALAILKRLDAAAIAAADLQQATELVFHQHPAAAIITSFPGLGPLGGARVLAEVGDDADRFETARDLKAYAGAAPVTRASGKSHLVLHRRVKNHRLASAGYNWAFAALTHSPGARAHYDRRRARGDGHAAALRNLYNRFLGQLHHCLRSGHLYDEITAFGDQPMRATAA